MATKTIKGTNLNDNLTGTIGDDIIYAFDGNDTVFAGSGNDVVDGNAGNDLINGGDGQDTLFGGIGNDDIIGGNGSNTIYGGTGNDKLTLSGGVASVIYGDGYDSFKLSGTKVVPTTQVTLPGNDVISGGSGGDTIYGDNGDNLTGSGAGGSDIIHGGGGSDTIYGEGGNDQLFGDEGNDQLFGGAGDDTLAGSLGADGLTGGSGNDRFVYKTASDSDVAAMDTIADFTQGQDKIDLTALLGAPLTWGGLSTQTVNGVWYTKSGGNTFVFADTNGDGTPELNVRLTGTYDLQIGDFLGVSAASVNQPPVGVPTITGTVTEDQVLTANTGGISDADGLGAFSYQWTRDGVDIGSATNSTYTLGDADVGALMRVRVSYTDLHGTVENVLSAATAAVANVNDLPLGVPTITGTVTEDQVLTANTGGISDADGLGAFSYQWTRDGVDIGSATNSTYTLGDADVGALMRVRVSYTDLHGTAEAVTSAATVAVNDAPVAQDVSASGAQNTTILVTLAGTDVDGTVNSFTLISLPGNGTLYTDGELNNAAELLTQYANPNFFFVPQDSGNVSFEYTVTDNLGGSDATPATVSIDVSGQETLHSTIIDGYIVGATVFSETVTVNGQWDAGEPITTTGANGQFSLVGATGPLVMFGGTDMSTGLAFQGTLTAPAGSAVVTPLTTLVIAMAGANPTPEQLAQAEADVKAALGVPASVDLAAFDPVLAAQSTDPDTAALGLSVYSVGVQVQNTIALAASLISGAGSSTYNESAAAVVAALVTQIGAATTTISLSDPAIAGAVVTEASGSTSTPLTLAQSAYLTDTIQNANTSVSNSTDLTAVAQAAVVAQGDASSSLLDGSVTGGIDYSNTSTFSAEANAATIGFVGGAELGTAGNDSLTLSASPGSLDGLGGNDTLTGGSGNDYLFGSDGKDNLSGVGGDDQLFGGAGNDTLIGGAGNDILDGGENPAGQLADQDAIDYSTEGGPGGVTVNLAAHTAIDTFGSTDTLKDIERAIGTTFDDTFTGGDVSNLGVGIAESFEGLGGNDTITGGNIAAGYATFALYTNAPGAVAVNLSSTDITLGVNTLFHGTAWDGYGTVDTLVQIFGVRGSAYDDFITGSDATTAERFEAGAGNDTIDGGLGAADYVHYTNSPNAVVVQLSPAGTVTVQDGYGTTDTLINIEGVRGTNFNDTLLGSDNSAPINGVSVVERFEGLAGDDTITGDLGQDQVEYGQSPTGVIVNLSAAAITVGSVTVDSNRAVDGFGGIDVLSGIERAFGSRFNDTMYGGIEANRFDGGLGDDTLNGGDGNDTLIGGAGSDSLVGGLGTDRVDYSASTSGVVVDLGATTASNDGLGGADSLSEIEEVTGSAFNDTITGDALANKLDGGAGNDTLIGAVGNDTLIGGSGTDRVDYSASTSAVVVNLGTNTASNDGLGGADSLSGIEEVTGSAFNDTITGNNSNNRLDGGAGNDTIDGGAGIDLMSFAHATAGVSFTLSRGAGSFSTGALAGGLGTDFYSNIEGMIGSNFNDTLTGSSLNDTLQGGAGNDMLDGGIGIDFAAYNFATGSVTVNLAAGTATGAAGSDTLLNIENVLGSPFNDTIIGDAGNNRLESGSGPTGNDTLEGGDGNDTLVGGAGNNMLLGGAGDDSLNPGGNDGTAGAEYVDGGDGIDTLDRSTAGTVPQNINLLAGTNDNRTVVNVENAIGAAGNDTIIGDAGNNRLEGGAGNDAIDGGAGIDLISFAGATAGVSVTLSQGAGPFSTGALAGGLGTDTYSNIEGVVGSNFNDTLTGSSLNDILQGGAGNDDLVGGLGNNTLVGGAGNDWIVADQPSSVSTGNNVLVGETGNDTLDGANGNDFLDGGDGDDFIWGELGDDTIIGGLGNDYLIGMGDNDSIDGGGGDDWIEGQGGNDLLIGGDGVDTLIGGAGNDSLTGGTGADTFVIDNNDSGITVATADTITDFTTGSDTIKLGLAGDATPGTGNYVEASVAATDFAAAQAAANAALTALAGTSPAAELYAFQFDGANGYLFDDTNGDGTADQVIVLTGITNTGIAATDIIA